MKKEWKYVHKDGNPTEPGIYWVTLLYESSTYDAKTDTFTFTGEKHAKVDSRYFCDLDKEPEFASWRMEDQPETGLAWTEESGSAKGETVWAWMPMEHVEIAEIPDGYIKEA